MGYSGDTAVERHIGIDIDVTTVDEVYNGARSCVVSRNTSDSNTRLSVVTSDDYIATNGDVTICLVLAVADTYIGVGNNSCNEKTRNCNDSTGRRIQKGT